MRPVLPALLACLLCGAAAAETPRLKIELPVVEKAAEEHSPALQAAGADWSAAQRRGESRRGELWPRLTLDGSYKYLSEVPSLSLAPGRSQSFGDNDNYSIGPTLNWTLWDQGALREGWRSADLAARARSEEHRSARRQVRLRARLAYFQAQLASEQVRLLGDSFRLAQSQYRDIEKRRQAGTSSRTDSLSAHQEVLARKRLLRQARADLAVALRELFALTGQDPGCDLSLPLDAGMAQLPPDGIEPASVFISLDDAGDSRRALDAAAARPPGEAHPAVQAFASLAESSRHAARSARAGLWPRVLLSARTSLDYPNGPVLESFNQNMVGVTASLPLFEAGRARRDAAQLESQARAGDWRKEAVRRDLARDWLKAQDQLLGLDAQQEINRQAVAEAGELAKLVYDSYRGGRSTFIEVEAANLKELEARTQAARTGSQILMQLAVLASLSEKE